VVYDATLTGKVSDISEELAATIFKVAEDLDLSVDGGNMLHRNVSKELSDSAASSSRGPLSSSF